MIRRRMQNNIHQASSMVPAGVGIGGHCWMSFEDLDLEWSGPNLVCPTDKRRGGSLTVRMFRKSESRRRASIDLPDIKPRGLQPTSSSLLAPFTVGSSDSSTIHQVQRCRRARCRVDPRRRRIMQACLSRDNASSVRMKKCS